MMKSPVLTMPFISLAEKIFKNQEDGTTNRKTIKELLSNVDKTKPVFCPGTSAKTT